MQAHCTLLLIFTAIGAPAQPLVDYHQHLFHPDVTGMAPETGTITADQLVAYLDVAEIRRALMLSVLTNSATQIGLP
jgi:hypothetical protein